MLTAQERVANYRRQAGLDPNQPSVLTPKQRRRVKQKARRRHESGELS